MKSLNQALLKSYYVELQECFISYPPELVASGLTVGNILDLSFLDPLRLPNDEETFLPKKIYVRQCMKDVFDLFISDATSSAPGKFNTVLLGSPGVGKSVLFFLGALYHARTSFVAYTRLSENENGISLLSLFLMMPNENESVRVWFTRRMPPSGSEYNVSDIMVTILFFNGNRNGDFGVSQVYTFVDGPRHSDKENTLQGHYDYLCTSGGHPLPKQEHLRFRRWVLSGWSKDEAIAGLTAVVENTDEELFERVYELCGGCIRNMIRATKEYEHVKKETDDLLTRLTESQIAIAVISSERKDDEMSFDRVRTMFQLKPNELPVQKVDSTYILNKLCQTIAVQKWLEAYSLGVRIEDGAFQEICFERCVHAWFTREKPDPVTSVCWSEGTAEDGINALVSKNVYWIPGVTNFPNIDSAVVVGNKLYALQMTCKRGKKPFDPETFFKNFVQVVQRTFNKKLLTTVHVFLLVPIGVQADLGCKHRRLTSTVHPVDTTSTTSFDETMKNLPFLFRSRRIRHHS